MDAVPAWATVRINNEGPGVAPRIFLRKSPDRRGASEADMILLRPQFARPVAACAAFALVCLLGSGSARAIDMNSVIGPLPGEVGTPCGPSGSPLPPGYNAPIPASNSNGNSSHASVDGSATATDTKTTCRGGHVPRVVGGSGTISFPGQGGRTSAPPPTSNSAKSSSLPAAAQATSVTPTYTR